MKLTRRGDQQRRDLIGALFNGVQFDAGYQEIVKWEASRLRRHCIASGQILGDINGLVTLDIDTTFTSARSS